MLLDYSPAATLSSNPGTNVPGTLDGMLRNDFGDHVRAARLAKGLTQREAADLVGVSYQLVSQIENGAVNTTIDTAESFARVLGIGVSFAETPAVAGPVVPASRRAIADRFLAVLPMIADDELDVFVHQLALWERRHRGQDSANRGR